MGKTATSFANKRNSEARNLLMLTDSLLKSTAGRKSPAKRSSPSRLVNPVTASALGHNNSTLDEGDKLPEGIDGSLAAMLDTMLHKFDGSDFKSGPSISNFSKRNNKSVLQ